MRISLDRLFLSKILKYETYQGDDHEDGRILALPVFLGIGGVFLGEQMRKRLRNALWNERVASKRTPRQQMPRSAYRKELRDVFGEDAGNFGLEAFAQTPDKVVCRTAACFNVCDGAGGRKLQV